MSFQPEAVTSPNSGLVFVNYYDASVTDAYRGAILSAEHELQGHFTNQTTVAVYFDFAPLTGQLGASLTFSSVKVDYASFAAALRANATSTDDQIATHGLPAADPSGGLGFGVPTAEARILGLAAPSRDVDLHVTLSSTAAWSFGQDATGVIEHELAEGVFGRVASLGYDAGVWRPMDLFRFTTAGVRDASGGKDGLTTYFGLDASHVSSFAFHNGVSSAGVYDGSDLADWTSTTGDAFGPNGPGSPGSLSATDLQVLDVLGWKEAAFAPAPDDYANSLSDTSHGLGHLASGGGAVAGTLQQAGDRDWFSVSLQADHSYAINLAGVGGNSRLADAYLRLHDAGGGLLASNDDKNAATSDSQIIFTAPADGTYYVEAGGFADGYAGDYTVSVSSGWTSGADVLRAGAGNTELYGGAGNDTLYGWSGGDYLRGDDGDDSILGGSGFDDINGNKGQDTIDGGSGGDDWLVGGQGNDSITAHASGNILYGNLGNDTLIGGSGAEILRGGQGDDTISGGAGNDWISGDRGSDTVSGGAGADVFHTFSGAGFDKVMDFNAAEGDRVMLDPGTTYTLSQVGSDTVIDMGNGDKMVLVGVTLSTLPQGWIFGA